MKKEGCVCAYVYVRLMYVMGCVPYVVVCGVCVCVCVVCVRVSNVCDGICACDGVYVGVGADNPIHQNPLLFTLLSNSSNIPPDRFQTLFGGLSWRPLPKE